MPEPKPPPPENLVGALQDPVHINKGRLLGTQPIRTGRKTMPEPKLTDAERDEAKWLWSLHPLMLNREGIELLQDYLARALAELEALRAWQAASTAPAVPLILRDREPPRPQRRKRG